MQKQAIMISEISHRMVFQEDEEYGLQMYLKTILSLDDDKKVEYTVRHSRHSRKRASQRSLHPNIILNVLLLGTTFFRQGMTFYTVKEKDLPKYLNHQIAEKIKNLVVVLGDNTTSVVTCYYTKNAVKYLKRKGKELKR